MTQEKSSARPPLMIRIARIAAIAFALFLSVFALDVFEPGVPIGQTLTALEFTCCRQWLCSYSFGSPGKRRSSAIAVHFGRYRLHHRSRWAGHF